MIGDAREVIGLFDASESDIKELLANWDGNNYYM